MQYQETNNHSSFHLSATSVIERTISSLTNNAIKFRSGAYFTCRQSNKLQNRSCISLLFLSIVRCNVSAPFLPLIPEFLNAVFI